MVKGHSVQKFQWKQTDEQMHGWSDEGYCIWQSTSLTLYHCQISLRSSNLVKGSTRGPPCTATVRGEGVKGQSHKVMQRVSRNCHARHWIAISTSNLVNAITAGSETCDTFSYYRKPEVELELELYVELSAYSMPKYTKKVMIYATV